MIILFKGAYFLLAVMVEGDESSQLRIANLLAVLAGYQPLLTALIIYIAYLFIVCLKTGLPPGVCNLVFGTGPKAGAAIVKHPDIPVISFTGSTATGQTITQMSAPFYKKLSLEVSTDRVISVYVRLPRGGGAGGRGGGE